jgi:hypothetical protein
MLKCVKSGAGNPRYRQMLARFSQIFPHTKTCTCSENEYLILQQIHAPAPKIMACTVSLFFKSSCQLILK